MSGARSGWRRLLVLGWAVGLLFEPAVAAEEPVLNVFNWADYVGLDTVSNFEQEFGIDVNYDLYDSTEVVEAKLLSGRTGYDIVIHSYRYSSRLIQVGVYQPLDDARLSGQDNLDEWVLGMVSKYDPENRFGVPYMWGTTGFAYNIEMVLERMPDAPVDSAALLFDPAVVSRFADCGVTLLDEPTDVIPMVLLYLGHDPNSLDPEVIAEAEEQLKRVRPFIRYFSSTKMINDLPNRETCIAMSWSGDYQTAMQRAAEVGANVRLAYTTPREGTMLWFDGVFIPADAPHVDNAHLFLNYLMRPEVAAGISNTTFYANANKASRPFMLRRLVEDPAVYPSLAERQGFKVGFVFSPKDERQRTRSWARIKSGL
jgi:putrescine transport system substrate-binding protein